MIKVAKDFVDGVTFCVADKNIFANEVSAFGFEEETAVVAGLFDNTGKYAMENEFR